MRDAAYVQHSNLEAQSPSNRQTRPDPRRWRPLYLVSPPHPSSYPNPTPYTLNPKRHLATQVFSSTALRMMSMSTILMIFFLVLAPSASWWAISSVYAPSIFLSPHTRTSVTPSLRQVQGELGPISSEGAPVFQTLLTTPARQHPSASVSIRQHSTEGAVCQTV